MNKKIIYLFSLLFLMVSCAEEGPFTLGTLNCDVQVVYKTSTMASLEVSFPSADNNLFLQNTDKWDTSVFVLDHQLVNHQNLYDQGAIKGQSMDGDRWIFGNLKPNTTYYVVIKHDVIQNLGEDGYGEPCYYDTQYTFTTNAEEVLSILIEQEVVTPFTANLKVSFPIEESQYLDYRNVKLFLSDKPFGPQSDYTYESVYGNRDYIWGLLLGEHYGNPEPVEDYQFTFTGLDPETRYYIGVLVDGCYKFGNGYFAYAYISDRSFTTESMGEIAEVSVEPEWITPNDAMLNVIFQPSEKNYLSSMRITVFLSDKPFENPSDHSYDTFLQNKYDYLLSSQYSVYNNREIFEFFKRDLSPETNYNIGVLFEGYYPAEWGGGYCRYVYYTDQSFATTAPGDYSKLGNISFEFLGNKGERTYAKLCFPESFSYAINDSMLCVASLNPDFSDSIQGHWEYEGYIREYYNLKPNEISFYFPILESGQYYVKFEGTLVMKFESEYINNEYDRRINVTDLKIDGPIEYEN